MAGAERPSRSELPRRFYADATVAPADEGFTVHLDGRPMKTPLRRPLAVPTRRLAESLAQEWMAQGERIDPATMPLTRLVNTVVDGVAADLGAVRADIGAYVETDLLFYRVGEPERLALRQREIWDPIVAWADGLFATRFHLAEGVMHVRQPAAAVAAFRARIEALADPFAVGALHQMTTLTGSALIAFAVAMGRLSLQDGWSAAHLDEDWNIEQWGGDAEAAARRAARFADMQAAVTLLRGSNEAAIHSGGTDTASA